MGMIDPKKLHDESLPAIVPEQTLPNFFLLVYILDVCGVCVRVRVCVSVYKHTCIVDKIWAIVKFDIIQTIVILIALTNLWLILLGITCICNVDINWLVNYNIFALTLRIQISFYIILHMFSDLLGVVLKPVY